MLVRNMVVLMVGWWKPKRPEKDFALTLSHQYTNGDAAHGWPKSLSKYQLYGGEDEYSDFLRSNSADNQPKFSKNITKLSMESVINDQWGVIGSFNRTLSKIPLIKNPSISDKQKTPLDPSDLETATKTQKRLTYNAFGKVYYDPSPDLGFELSYTYAPDYDYRYMTGSRDEFYTWKHGGHLLGFTTKWNNPWGKLTNTLNYSRLEDTTESDNYEYTRYWYPSENKNWGRFSSFVREGGYAPSVSKQSVWSNKLVQEFKPFDLAKTTHNVKAGVELSHTKASFHYTRPFIHVANNSGQMAMTAEQRQKCIDGGDYTWCDPSKSYHPPSRLDNIDNINEFEYDFNGNKLTYWPYGQWLYKGYYFNGGTKTSNKQAALFLEDNIEIPLNNYGKVEVRPGVRLDYDSLMRKTTFAPRLSADYAFPWSESKPQYATHLTAGWNRYYGRNMYAYALNDGINALNTDIVRADVDVNWQDVIRQGQECGTRWGSVTQAQNCVVKYKSDVKFSELKIPYVDEQMIGLSQDFAHFNVTAKYIHRNGRDEVVTARRSLLNLDPLAGYDDSYTVFTNNGRSKTDVLTLTLKSTKPWVWGGVKNNLSLGFDWTQVERNKESYNTSISQTDIDDAYVLYGGNLIRWSERPASNFVKPYSIKLSTEHDWKMLGGDWHWYNLFSFRQGYKAYVNTRKPKTGQELGVAQAQVDVYDVAKLPSTFTWDTRLGVEYPVYKKNKLFVNVDVFNVLNKRNVGLASLSRTGEVTPTYEMGRSVWFELGYKYY